MEEIWHKSETVDPEVRAYVISLVNAVGGSSTYDDSYTLGDDALAALNDLLRWMRLYDEKLGRYDVKRCLADANLVKGDLLEILALWPEQAAESKMKAKLALACLQLLVPLTWPLELDAETTVHHHRHIPYLQLAQIGYKRSILAYEHAQILRTAVRISLPSIAQPRRERTRRDEGIIKLVLYLFRNLALLTQPQQLPSQGDENDVSRSATICAFHAQDVFTLLLTIGSGSADEFQEEDVVLLEILFHLLKGIDPKKLFLREKQLHSSEADELRSLMQREKAMHAGYAKTAPSRHNRFGTMLWVKRADDKVSTLTGQATIADSSSTLQAMDASKKWNKPKPRPRASDDSIFSSADFTARVDLTPNARNDLAAFVADFLDSSFNPLFASLRKAIERETDRVTSTHVRQYFFLMHWFLDAEAGRRASNPTPPSQPSSDDNSFALIAAVLDQETFSLLSRSMQRFHDEKSWPDLHCTLLAFTRILETISSMAQSKDEEDQDIEENIQQRIFYEEAMHDRLVQILRGYANQGLGYLDAVTECVHVFVRMLERYSKENVDLQVRSKRRARVQRKKKQVVEQVAAGGEAVDESAEPVANAEEENDNDNDNEEQSRVVASERKFDFARFSAKFLSQPCLDTFIALLHFHADLSPAQLKRVHRYLYRLAFKHELTLLLFRVDILQLLHRLIKGPGGLPKGTEGFKDWEQLVQQVFRRCVKWVEKPAEGEGWKEMCVVEMLFSKTSGNMFYLQNGYERVVEKRAPRPPQELEFKRVVEEGKKLGVVVSLLVELGKQVDVEWVLKELERAVQERTAWADSLAARAAAIGDAAATELATDPPSIFMAPDTEERKSALFKDKHLRLLLTTIGCERLGSAEDVEATWNIPPELSTDALRESLEAVKTSLHTPPTFDDGAGPADLIKPKSLRRTAATFDSDSDAGSNSGGEILFPPNAREERKEGYDAERAPKRRRLTKRSEAPELTEAEAEARAAERRRKEREKNARIKSEIFVTAEMDESDEEGDREFFRLEEERRRRVGVAIRGALARRAEEGDGDEKGKGGRKRKRKVGGENVAGARKKKGRGKQAVVVESDEEDEVMVSSESDADASGESDVEMVAQASVPRRQPQEQRPIFIEDDDSASEQDDEVEEETPSTSPPGEDVLPLREVSGNIGVLKQRTEAAEMVSGDDDRDEDDGPVKVMRRRRTGVVLDDSDDD